MLLFGGAYPNRKFNPHVGAFSANNVVSSTLPKNIPLKFKSPKISKDTARTSEPGLNAHKAPSGRRNRYMSFHGMSLRSISWNSAAEISPRIPITTMPTNM